MLLNKMKKARVAINTVWLEISVKLKISLTKHFSLTNIFIRTKFKTNEEPDTKARLGKCKNGSKQALLIEE
jgi:hypothetical protein